MKDNLVEQIKGGCVGGLPEGSVDVLLKSWIDDCGVEIAVLFGCKIVGGRLFLAVVSKIVGDLLVVYWLVLLMSFRVFSFGNQYFIKCWNFL